ncbi:MAG: cytochrome c3 family protein [Thermoanaerobaculia bacterium]|jgi:hypothetical protein
MNSRVVTLALVVLGLLSLIALVPAVRAVRFPGNHQGYEPSQPIAYSHRLHAGELAIPCEYCHYAADRSRHAGIPSATKCMNCHRFVSAARSKVRAEEELAKSEGREPRRVVSPEIQKLYDALALGPDMKQIPGKPTKPIEWARIHKVPDFVYFDHRAHVKRGVTCQKCHGPVETMERMRQQETLLMGWCVNCHRGVGGALVSGQIAKGSTDCSVCHY